MSSLVSDFKEGDGVRWRRKYVPAIPDDVEWFEGVVTYVVSDKREMAVLQNGANVWCLTHHRFQLEPITAQHLVHLVNDE